MGDNDKWTVERVLNIGGSLAGIATIIPVILPFFASVPTGATAMLSVVGLIALIAFTVAEVRQNGSLYRVRFPRYVLAIMFTSYLAAFVHYWSEAHERDTQYELIPAAPESLNVPSPPPVNRGDKPGPDLNVAILNLIGVYGSAILLVASLSAPRQKTRTDGVVPTV